MEEKAVDIEFREEGAGKEMKKLGDGKLSPSECCSL
jgi:hypothetical protein